MVGCIFRDLLVVFVLLVRRCALRLVWCQNGFYIVVPMLCFCCLGFSAGLAAVCR